MDKGKLKRVKAVYYPYKAVKKVVLGLACCYRYPCSLHYIKINKKRVQKKIKNKEIINVVFIVQYIPSWNKLEPIYTKMKQDNRFNPIILCVPLNIQNHKLMDNNGNDTFEYFVNHGYDAIDSLQGITDWFDLKQLKPDYVFHSRPYNHFMPKEYTSGKIVKYALICNVMYGLCLTHGVEPVLLNKDYFKDCYIYFAFSEEERAFYIKRFELGMRKGIQQCFCYGGLGIEQILRANRKEKENNGFRLKVMWTPRWSTDPKNGGSNFFNYKDCIFKIVSEHKDVQFIIRPHPLMFENFKKTGEMTEKEIAEFKLYCNETSNVLLDESKEYMSTFWKIDILITDSSAIVPEYFFTNKPMMFCCSSINETNTLFFDDIISASYCVDSKESLKTIFSLLISGNDYKAKDRLLIYSKYYNKYINNSKKIVELLANWKQHGGFK